MGTNLPFVAGGGRYASNDVLLDGIDNNTSINAGSIGRNGIAYTPSADAVEEFKVKTNNLSAEFGRSAGAIISASLKSGTNDLRGSAWEFVRNEKFDANNFFSNTNRVPRQPFKQNQYGFTLGGPVYVPKLYNGKNRTFFFFDYEATRRRTSASSSTLDIPPMSFRTGDFSSYTPRIYDPNARRLGPSGTVISTPFPGNIIPQNQLNKSSLAIVGLLPPPNVADTPFRIARNMAAPSTPLMHAAAFGNFETLKALIDAGADVNARNQMDVDATALLWAAGAVFQSRPRSVQVGKHHHEACLRLRKSRSVAAAIPCG